MEETWRQNGWTEEAQEDGTTDQLEAGVFPLQPKLLSDAVQSVLQITAQTHTRKLA